MKQIALLAWLVLWGPLCNAAEPQVSVSNPRPFGYVIGDTFVQRISIQIDQAAQFDEKSMPKVGRLNAWLELRAAEIGSAIVKGAMRYDVTLTYQLPNSPPEIKVIELPAQRFLFNVAGKVSEAKTIEWPITLAPITPAEVLARDGLEALRPDIVPPTIATTGYRLRVLAYIGALSAIGLYWLYRMFGIPFLARQQRPFTAAYRDLSKLKDESSEHGFAQAIARIHKALNQTAGKSVFSENVAQFLADHPARERLLPLTQQFFELSRQAFFADQRPPKSRSLEWLRDFCRAWRDVERGLA